jgi:hypothetical protein
MDLTDDTSEVPRSFSKKIAHAVKIGTQFFPDMNDIDINIVEVATKKIQKKTQEIAQKQAQQDALTGIALFSLSRPSVGEKIPQHIRHRAILVATQAQHFLSKAYLNLKDTDRETLFLTLQNRNKWSDFMSGAAAVARVMRAAKIHKIKCQLPTVTEDARESIDLILEISNRRHIVLQIKNSRQTTDAILVTKNTKDPIEKKLWYGAQRYKLAKQVETIPYLIHVGNEIASSTTIEHRELEKMLPIIKNHIIDSSHLDNNTFLFRKTA